MAEQSQELKKAEREESWRVELRSNTKAKDRASIERVKMSEVEPIVRNKSHVEVNLGINAEQAMLEAKRCLDCADPTCMCGCPVGVNIPKFVKFVEAGDFLAAARTLKETNSFPAICGRVCPQESQCESQCMYPVKMKKHAISIGNLERFVADYELKTGKIHIPEISDKKYVKVGVIGSGPAGLSVAGDLAKMGYQVTIFEALHEFGGVLKYGIPEFRLPNNIVDHEISMLQKMGVSFVKNFVVGKTATLEDLKEQGFQAFFVGSGAGLPKFMNIPGENYVGIMSANEYLTRINLMGASREDYDTPILPGQNVAVIGGGNTAMDSVRTAKRLGAKRAIIIYRRSFEEMPARKEEVKHALEEGVEFLNLTNPISYSANATGHVTKIKVQKMELGEPDNSGRRSPVAIPGSEYNIDIDLAVVSIGVSPNPLIPQSMGELETTRWQTIKVDNETMHSNVEGIFAGGDIVRGGATVILAMGDGRKAAKGIDEYLKKKGLI